MLKTGVENYNVIEGVKKWYVGVFHWIELQKIMIWLEGGLYIANKSECKMIGLRASSEVRNKMFQSSWTNLLVLSILSMCLGLSSRLTIHRPPLYLPKKCLQFGHLWDTVFRDSMQHGMHAQGQSPTTQRTPARIHAMAPGSDSVLVLI